MFWLDPDIDLLSQHSTCGGGHDYGCNGLHAPAADVTMTDMAVQATALTIMRTQEGVLTQRARDSLGLRGDELPFVEHELEAALALAEEALQLVPEINDILLPHLYEGMKADDVYEAIYSADRHWRRSTWQKDTAQRFTNAVALSVAAGGVHVDPAAYIDPLFRNRIIDGMTRAGKYYSNEFFNRQVMPALITTMDRALAGDNVGSVAGFKMMQATLKARLKSVPYWQVVANSAASRAYHYGVLRAGIATGKRSYRFYAVVDERTSEVCNKLNGTVWSVDTAASLMEQIAQAEHPEDIKDIAPWPRAKDIEAMSPEELSASGVYVPPLHPRCRSTIVLF